MNTDAMVQEANALIAEGWEEIQQPWREGAVIESHDNMLLLTTHGRGAEFTHGEVAAGEHRKTLRNLGRSAAIHMGELIERSLSNWRQRYPGVSLKLVINVLKERLLPRVEVDVEEGIVQYRVYHDFSLSAVPSTESE